MYKTETAKTFEKVNIKKLTADISLFRKFDTYQIAFLMTCQQHKFCTHFLTVAIVAINKLSELFINRLLVSQITIFGIKLMVTSGLKCRFCKKLLLYE
jgi:hypothetical protein